MTPYSKLADLGPVISEHRHTLTYPIIVSILAVVLILGSFAMALNANPVGGAIFGAIVTASWMVYLWREGRQRLYLHENGLRLQSGSNSSTLLWTDLTKVKVSFSYDPHPDAILDVDFRQQGGPRLVLQMNWTRRKELSRRLWPILEARL